MHRIKLALMALMAITAITAIGAATASAGELGFLPREPFKGTSGAGTLEALAGTKITCTSDTVLEGTFEGEKDKRGKIASIHFKGCKTGGFPAKSLGDESEVILVTNVVWLVCFINKANLELGVLLTLPSGGVHIEVPIAKILFNVSGSVVGKVVTADNKLLKVHKIEFSQNAGMPNQTKCEGEAADKLLLELETKEPEESGLLGKEEVEPEKEKAETELMEE